MSEAILDPFPAGVAPPWTPAGLANPQIYFETMLHERPIAYDPEVGAWHFFGYERVKDFLKHPEDWSTAKRLERIPVAERVVRLLTSDPPQHQPLRDHFSRAYRPKRIQAMEQHIRTACRSLLRAGIERGGFDVIADFAHPLTATMIRDLIGVPDEAQERINISFNTLGPLSTSDGPRAPMLLHAGGTATEEQHALNEYFDELIARRRREPQDDLVSDLAAIPAEQFGEKFDVGVLLNEQLAAGQATTTHLIGNTIALLDEYPEQLAKLRADPKLVPSAIEEVLRYVSPLQARPRISARPLEVDGIEIPEGALGLGWLQAANRDPDAFEDPGRFDVQRDPNHHLAFGHGEHFCMGSWLARMEGRVALEEWLLFIERYRLAEERPLQWAPDFLVRGPSRLPVEVTAA